MKITKKLALITLSAAMLLPNISVKPCFSVEISSNLQDSSVLESDAEKLYLKINEFLNQNSKASSTELDQICRDYMNENIPAENLLTRSKFEEQSATGSILLYRGLTRREFAENLKKGKIYIASNTKNVRGMGVYTTSSWEIAESFSDENDRKTIVKMFIPKTGINILKNEYLEKLKNIISTRHKEEFGEFSSENKQSYIFDNLDEYFDAHKDEVLEIFKKIESENIQDAFKQRCLFLELHEKWKKDPIYQKEISNHKRFFKTNKAAVFYNSGLLAKFLGYDVLYSNDFLNEISESKKEEYLIVNPKILYVLND